MLAYHNEPLIKSNTIAQLKAHCAADELIKGQYWENGKGCAIGCTIHSDDHFEYEIQFGIPIILAKLEDKIFEGLPNNLAMEWPVRFMNAIEVGSDLSMIWPHFALWLLTVELKPYGDKNPEVAQSLSSVAVLYQEWCNDKMEPSGGRWNAAASAAFTVAETATPDSDSSNAAYAAFAAADAAGAGYAGAGYAPYVAATAAAASVTASAAADAAFAAADAATNAAKPNIDRWNSAHCAAADACYVRMSDKLIELIINA